MPSISDLLSEISLRAASCRARQLTAYRQQADDILVKHLRTANDRESPLLRLPPELRLEIGKLVWTSALKNHQVSVPAGLRRIRKVCGVFWTCHRLRHELLSEFCTDATFIIRYDNLNGFDQQPIALAIVKLLWPADSGLRLPIKHIHVVGRIKPKRRQAEVQLRDEDSNHTLAACMAEEFDCMIFGTLMKSPIISVMPGEDGRSTAQRYEYVAQQIALRAANRHEWPFRKVDVSGFEIGKAARARVRDISEEWQSYDLAGSPAPAYHRVFGGGRLRKQRKSLGPQS